MNLHDELKISAFDKFDTKKRKAGEDSDERSYASLSELVFKDSANINAYIKTEKED